MCQYAGDTKYPQYFNPTQLTDKEINDIIKSLLGESLENYSKMGLNPFCALNPAPDVSVLSKLRLAYLSLVYQAF